MAMSNDNGLRLGDPVRRLPSFSLKNRMLVYFGVLFTAVIVILKLTDLYGIPFTKYEGNLRKLQSEAFRELSLVAELKKERLLRWMEERREDTIIGREPNY